MFQRTDFKQVAKRMLAEVISEKSLFWGTKSTGTRVTNTGMGEEARLLFCS